MSFVLPVTRSRAIGLRHSLMRLRRDLARVQNVALHHSPPQNEKKIRIRQVDVYSAYARRLAANLHAFSVHVHKEGILQASWKARSQSDNATEYAPLWCQSGKPYAICRAETGSRRADFMQLIVKATDMRMHASNFKCRMKAHHCQEAEVGKNDSDERISSHVRLTWQAIHFLNLPNVSLISSTLAGVSRCAYSLA